MPFVPSSGCRARESMKASVRMFEKVSDQAMAADVTELQALSVVTDDVAGLARKHRRRGGHDGKTNVCLITLNNSANGIDILNILNGFGI